MEPIKQIKKIVNDLFLNINAFFTGIYYKEDVVFFKILKKEKEKVVPELAGLLVRKFINSTDLIGSPEYLFTEGNRYAIFLFNAGNNITLVSIIEGKPNLSLLRLEHDKASKLLQGLSKEIPSMLEKLQKEREEQKDIQEEVEEDIEVSSTKASTKKETASILEDKEQEIVKEQTLEKEKITYEEKIDEDIKEVEEKISSTSDETLDKQEEKNISINEEVLEETELTKEVSKEKQEIEKQEKDPSLEEILSTDINLGEEINPEIVDKLKLKFIEEIGPVGKFLFKKTVKKINLDINKPYKHQIEELIEKLADEIVMENRKENFINYAKQLLEEDK